MKAILMKAIIENLSEFLQRRVFIKVVFVRFKEMCIDKIPQ